MEHPEQETPIFLNANDYSVKKLNDIRVNIENMNKINHINVLKMLRSHKVTLNENNYGVHVNLTELKNDIIDDLVEYIKYVNAQEENLQNDEIQKMEYTNTYFSTNI
tara:strand:- start:972 stop:1292 length:321 start_codon:yes stop_codon:yes gene_type:complete